VLEVVSGGAVFPTGKRFVFSPERRNFYEGLGAIEMRSYYAGENRITAKAEGLAIAELMINAVGEDLWEDQKRTELLPPPSVMGMPKHDKSFNIGVSRPVFASSEQPDYAARNVTDQSSTKPWRATAKKQGEWIMIDLEGSKPVNRGEVFFEEVNCNPYEIGISSNGVDFEVITVSNDRAVNSFLDISLSGKVLRYFRVRFLEEAAAIIKIKLYS
jgi:beta-galactosidase